MYFGKLTMCFDCSYETMLTKRIYIAVVVEILQILYVMYVKLNIRHVENKKKWISETLFYSYNKHIEKLCFFTFFNWRAEQTLLYRNLRIPHLFFFDAFRLLPVETV